MFQKQERAPPRVPFYSTDYFPYHVHLLSLLKKKMENSLTLPIQFFECLEDPRSSLSIPHILVATLGISCLALHSESEIVGLVGNVDSRMHSFQSCPSTRHPVLPWASLFFSLSLHFHTLTMGSRAPSGRSVR